MSQLSRMSSSGTECIDVYFRMVTEKTFSMRLDPSLSISDIKVLIEGESEIASCNQRLIFKGQVLRNEFSLSSYGVESGSTIHVVGRGRNDETNTTPAGTTATNSQNIPVYPRTIASSVGFFVSPIFTGTSNADGATQDPDGGTEDLNAATANPFTSGQTFFPSGTVPFFGTTPFFPSHPGEAPPPPPPPPPPPTTGDGSGWQWSYSVVPQPVVIGGMQFTQSIGQGQDSNVDHMASQFFNGIMSNIMGSSNMFRGNMEASNDISPDGDLLIAGDTAGSGVADEAGADEVDPDVTVIMDGNTADTAEVIVTCINTPLPTGPQTSPIVSGSATPTISGPAPMPATSAHPNVSVQDVPVYAIPQYQPPLFFQSVGSPAYPMQGYGAATIPMTSDSMGRVGIPVTVVGTVATDLVSAGNEEGEDVIVDLTEVIKEARESLERISMSLEYNEFTSSSSCVNVEDCRGGKVLLMDPSVLDSHLSWTALRNLENILISRGFLANLPYGNEETFHNFISRYDVVSNTVMRILKSISRRERLNLQFTDISACLALLSLINTELANLHLSINNGPSSSSSSRGNPHDHWNRNSDPVASSSGLSSIHNRGASSCPEEPIPSSAESSPLYHVGVPDKPMDEVTELPIVSDTIFEGDIIVDDVQDEFPLDNEMSQCMKHSPRDAEVIEHQLEEEEDDNTSDVVGPSVVDPNVAHSLFELYRSDSSFKERLCQVSDVQLSEGYLREASIIIITANGLIFYNNLQLLKNKRPTFMHKEPPTEKHRMQIYDSLASTYDSMYEPLNAHLGVDKAKAVLLKHAKGHVLDVAAGTLNNLKYYENIDSLTAIDKSVNMCIQMKKRIEHERPSFPVTVLCGDVSSVPFGNSSFNTVVSTYALCSLEEPGKCVREIARVMKPSARSMLKVYPNPMMPWKYGYFEDRNPVLVSAEKCAQYLPV